MEFGSGGRGTWGRARRAIWALAVMGTVFAGCSKTNPDFCSEEDRCLTGYECSANICIESPDASAAPDASLSCPTASHECVPAIPADWTGPSIRVDTSSDSALPACAVSDPGGLVAGADFDPTGTCTCECGTAETIFCTDATIEAVPGAAVGCTLTQCAGGCVDQSLVPNMCTAMVPGILDENNVRMTAGTVTGGTCLPGALADITPVAAFQDVVALCASEPTEGDCGDALCASVSPPEFTGQTCIYREGQHDCPSESGYSEQTITFSSLNDTRRCDACECELPPAGSSCGGITRSCNIQGVSQDSGCVSADDWAVGATAFTYDPDPEDVECAPVERTPTLRGSVTGNDPITVCCTPAP